MNDCPIAGNLKGPINLLYGAVNNEKSLVQQHILREHIFAQGQLAEFHAKRPNVSSHTLLMKFTNASKADILHHSTLPLLCRRPSFFKIKVSALNTKKMMCFFQIHLLLKVDK